ncbi:MAG: tetratricopeptide repeat protein [Acidobacteriota bacterium]|nr:tetratricopeptide repeat protein [Acidobacteriota bacterium]
MFNRCACLVLLLATLSGVAHAAPDQWIELKTGHFTIYSDVGEKKTRQIGDQFERLRWMFQTLFPKVEVDPVEPLFVIALKNKKQFREFEPEAYLAKGTLDLAGYFANSSDRDYILLRTDTDTDHPYATVFHEYTHLQFRDEEQEMPLWLFEGMAEFFQNTDIRQKDVQLGEASVNDILFLRQNNLIPLADLFRFDQNSHYYHEENKGNIFYAESWALTHYLMITGKISNKDFVTDYMRHMARHEDPVQAAEECFGNLKKLQSALEDYIHNSSYKQFVLNSAAAAIDDSKFNVRSLSQPEVDASRADELAHVGRFDDADNMANAVLKEDSNNATAHEALAYSAFRKGNREAAMREYGNAVQLHTDNFFAWSMAAMQNFQSVDQSAKKIAQTDLQESIRLNPRYVLSYVNLAELYMSTSDLGDARKFLTEAQTYAHSPRDRNALNASIHQLKTMTDIAKQKPITPPQGQQVQAGTIITMPAPETPADMKHPNEPATGPKHVADGVIQSVKCGYPAVLELTVATKAKAVKLYINNYYQLQVSALNYTPQGDLQPCKDMQGMRARVGYAESSDKSVDGQIISIELRK